MIRTPIRSSQTATVATDSQLNLKSTTFWFFKAIPSTMPYEPGSPECRILISCKAQIESMLNNLSRIENTSHIRDQLVSVHNQLEGLHELHRRQPQGISAP
jgi:hypothetical protein